MIGDAKLSFINFEDGETYKVVFKQKNAGRFEILGWGNILFQYARPPNLSNDVNSTDILIIYGVEDKIYGALLNDFK